MVSNSLCRLVVQCDEENGVDLALPRDLPVGRLMPSIVDLVFPGAGTSMTAYRWRLSRVGGIPLDESMSLDGNAVQEGELLLLTDDEPVPPQWVVVDPSHTVARADRSRRWTQERGLSTLCCLALAGVGAAVLIRSGALTTGVIVAVVTALGAIAARRDPPVCSPLALVAVLYATAVGLLSVPAGSVAAHVLLASAAAFSAATALLRLTDSVRCGLTAVAVFAMLAGIAAVAAVTWRWQADAGGAALAVLSLATLAAAPRIAIAVTGIRPACEVSTARAGLAHRTLTGLLTGTSTAAAIGAALAARGEMSNGSASAAVIFPMVVGVILALRARTYADGDRRVALAIGGLISATAGFAAGGVALPAHAHWLGLLAVVSGVASLIPLLGVTTNPTAQRGLDIVDYIALAAVVPAACWVGGLFGLVRDAALI